MPKTLFVENIDTDMWDALVEGCYTFLIGSGVSIWKPSGLPNGKKLTDYVYEDLLGSYFKSLRLPNIVKDEWFKQVPFEVVMDRCVDKAQLQNDLLKLYSAGKMNAIHKAIADYASKSQRRFICTTNYDKGLEKAFQNIRQPHNTVIRRKETAMINKKLPTLFKIHGSADKRYKDSMLFSLKQECRMPVWKRNFLNTVSSANAYRHPGQWKN